MCNQILPENITPLPNTILTGKDGLPTKNSVKDFAVEMLYRLLTEITRQFNISDTDYTTLKASPFYKVIYQMFMDKSPDWTQLDLERFLAEKFDVLN